MQVMQEDGKLLSSRLTLGRHCFLEKMMLNILRQFAPNPGNRVPQGANCLLFNLGRS
jgi:hypothetical protein